MKVWLGDQEPTLEDYVWVKEPTIFAVHTGISSLALGETVGTFTPEEVLKLAGAVQARFESVLIMDAGSEEGTSSRVELASKVADQVLVSFDSGLSYQ